jgi:hypothetical protein
MSLKNGDLEGTILQKVSIDEFEAKAGNEEDVIVVAFYLTDQEPADDLNTFIQRGVVDTLDVEVSPNTDEEGRYLVFVEMSRDDTFPYKFQALLKDIKNVAGKINWEVNTYLADDRIFASTDPALYNSLILTPDDYVPKEEFKMKEMTESIYRFFNDSLAQNLTVDGNIVTMSRNGRKIIAEVKDIGDYDTVIGRNYLSESAYKVGQNPFEAQVLQSMLGNCQVLPLGKYLCVSRDDKVMLLKHTQLDYRN